MREREYYVSEDDDAAVQLWIENEHVGGEEKKNTSLGVASKK